LIYSVSRSRIAPRVAKRACKALQHICGMNQPVFVCSLQHLVELVMEDPFSHSADPAICGQAISFFEPKIGTNVAAPIESERKDCIVFRIGEGEALSVLYEVNGKTGYPTPVLEKVLNSPVTTRSWTTIVRMIRMHG
jgi:uncharacterized protein (DUF1697 family)